MSARGSDDPRYISNNFKDIELNINLPMQAGGTFEWKVAQLDKLLSWLVAETPAFRDALQRALQVVFFVGGIVAYDAKLRALVPPPPPQVEHWRV